MNRIIVAAGWLGLAAGIVTPGPAPAADRPNILWLTSEDHGPQMGCYGDPVATTPHVDKLAARGMIYTRAWSNAPVCAPARTTLISGMYACSTGGENMRSLVPYPAGLAMFPQLLREAGYHCTNNAKEDYNLAKPGKVWDASGKQAHWRNRRANQPFFAVFNSEKSHESQIRARPHTLVHDPAKVPIPAYHPDTPEVRRDWAQYYDGVTAADADAGMRLDELDKAGLADDTIVFYFGDHGSGMPRSKRWPYNSGLRVPLVVSFPKKWRHLAPEGYAPGGRSDRLVGFVDFAPTVLSLAGVRPPSWTQGHAFLGEFAAPPQPFAFGFRGRMDERVDLVRTATDGRFVYARNYMPHLIYGQRIDYMFQTPTTRVWKALHDAGKLTPAQDAFWNPKPPEELYDLDADPDEVRNLAGSPEHRAILDRLRTAQQELARSIRDVGFLPEGERYRRAEGGSPYDLARDGDRYPFDRVSATADAASMLRPEALPALKGSLADPDAAVRYWAALGVLMRGRDGFVSAGPETRKALDDPSPDVRAVAGRILGQFGTAEDLARALPVLTRLVDPAGNDVFSALGGLDALAALGPKASPAHPAIGAFAGKWAVPDPRYATYAPRLLAEILAGPRAETPEGRP
ncbi:sulfatase-like hydrolase/transferase [Tundrisphaera sp. TA3]|uniref:sulfatase-like hydrolase/transferase n=1 Tax=Tundrisphaera sp. TA3 TaxID=3435775 RepID=UPI003EBEE184